MNIQIQTVDGVERVSVSDSELANAERMGMGPVVIRDSFSRPARASRQMRQALAYAYHDYRGFVRGHEVAGEVVPCLTGGSWWRCGLPMTDVGGAAYQG